MTRWLPVAVVLVWLLAIGWVVLGCAPRYEVRPVPATILYETTCCVDSPCANGTPACEPQP